MITWLLALTLGFTSQARAADDLVKVTALTQFVEGKIQKTEASGIKSDLVFQTPIYEGDRVDTEAGTALKLAARNGCIFVLRGVGTLASPVASKPWRMRAESLRLICNGRAAVETFGIANLPLAMKDGEVLFVGKQVMLVNGAASYMGVPLTLRKLYAVDGAELKEASPQPSASELRALNLAEKPPREAYDWPRAEAPRVEKVYSSRYMLGPVAGGDGVTYDNVDYAQGGLRGGGLRLQAQYKRKNDTALIFALTLRESEKNSENSPNTPPAAGPQNQVEFHTIEVGLRQSYDRWWSPFVRVGLGEAKAKIGYSSSATSGGSYSRFAYQFYVVNATWGIDAHFVPRFLRPFGFYTSAEGTVYQSFHRGARQNENSGYFQNAVPDEAWRLTGFDVLGSAGFELNF